MLKQLVEGSPSINVIALALHPRRRTHNYLRVWSGKSTNAEVKKWLTGQNRSKENTYKYVPFSIAHRYPLLYLYTWFLQPIHVLMFDCTGSVRSKRSDSAFLCLVIFLISANTLEGTKYPLVYLPIPKVLVQVTSEPATGYSWKLIARIQGIVSRTRSIV